MLGCDVGVICYYRTFRDKRSLSLQTDETVNKKVLILSTVSHLLSVANSYTERMYCNRLIRTQIKIALQNVSAARS